MHCELSVPALMPRTGDTASAAAAALQGVRLPALELLLARGRRSTDDTISLERWLAEAFGSDPDTGMAHPYLDEIPAGAITLAGSGGDAGDSIWMRADPVHLKLNRDQLLLVPASTFGVQAAEAEALTEALNRHFAGQLAFYPMRPECWCVRVESIGAEGLRTETPAEVAGKDVNRHLPAGEGSKRWHGVLNEIQMLLHEHPANEEREARGEPQAHLEGDQPVLHDQRGSPRRDDAGNEAEGEDDQPRVECRGLANGVRHRDNDVGKEDRQRNVVKQRKESPVVGVRLRRRRH